MPIGGLKWKEELEQELEPKEIKKVKSEVQVLGIDDAPFDRNDKEVKIVAVLTRGAKMLDGVFHSVIKKDGIDATDQIIHLVRSIKRENARAIILDGVTYGGFNTVDIQRIYRETGIPVIASMDRRPDHAAINKALRNLDNQEIRKKMIAAAGSVHEVKLDDERTAYMQIAGIKKSDAEELLKLTTVNGLVPEPVRAAHLIAKGAYTELPKEEEDEDWLHVKAYNYVRDKRKEIKRLKNRWFPGVAGEILSFLFALLVAWVLIQALGWTLGAANPLVVIESQSMEHGDDWGTWYLQNGMNPNNFGAMNIGDIILVKGDNPKDLQIGDVIVYTKYDGNSIGGEPVIHRIIGIAEINGNNLTVSGLVKIGYDKNNVSYLVTPCNSGSAQSAYSLDELRQAYSTDIIKKMYPGIEKSLDNFRVFITKGDNNRAEDQCKYAKISFPVHERLVQGRTKFDVPYLGYVKLGLVCTIRYATGNVCGCRCWWATDHPGCCK